MQKILHMIIEQILKKYDMRCVSLQQYHTKRDKEGQEIKRFLGLQSLVGVPKVLYGQLVGADAKNG